MNEEERTHLDLFSGIGGFALAAKWNGYRTLAFCEQDKYCQRVLDHHWPGTPCIPDVHDLDGKDYRGVTLLTGGFPCQPYSTAGKRGGKEDDRAIWPEMARVIDEARPTWVLGENVAGLISLGLDDVLSDLEGLGYRVQTFNIGAVSVNAPHRRARLWIVAWNTKGDRGHTERGVQKGKDALAGGVREDVGDPQRDGSQDGREETGGEIGRGEQGGMRQLEGTSDVGDPEHDGSPPSKGRGGLLRKPKEQGGQKEIGKSKGASGSPKHVADPERQRQQGQGASRDAIHPEEEKEGQTTRPFNGCEQGEWSVEPDVGRVAHGIPSRVDRLKGLGNAIVPQVAYQIIKAMQ